MGDGGKNALKEALLAIYGDMCLIFHKGISLRILKSGMIPDKATVHLLDTVVHIVFDKLLKLKSA